MVDILIPLMHCGSKYSNFELRMCLRSIEKHLKNCGNIYIVGERPGWIKNIIHIPFEDSTDNKQRAWNIYSKIMGGINYKITERFENGEENVIRQLSDNFLFVNDDHYLLTDYEASEFPYYHRGYVDLKYFSSNPAQYTQMRNTFLQLGNFYDFDVHAPILYNKEKFRNAFKYILKWPEYGFGIKSFYCGRVWSYYSIQMVNKKECEDLKFTERIFMKESIYKALEGRSWFSISDRSLLEGSKMMEVLEELYPKKSIYEQ